MLYVNEYVGLYIVFIPLLRYTIMQEGRGSYV